MKTRILILIAALAVLSGCATYNGSLSPASRKSVTSNAFLASVPHNTPQRWNRGTPQFGSTYIAREDAAIVAGTAEPFNTERYDDDEDTPFLTVAEAPLSTFSADVDTASYANVRRMIEHEIPIPKGAVRIEEMVNYFEYDYPQPTGQDPFSVTSEVADCPWKPEHKLARIGLRGKEIALEEREPVNLVFLLDVSGSMDSPNKLPLLKKSMKLLLEKLDERDRIGIVVYAGESGVALPSTRCSQRTRIAQAIDKLGAGGSTNGAAGIEEAYEMAGRHFIQGGVNRVILATDGDFNVGTSNRSDLADLIKEKAKSGVYLSVLGYGMGNYNDAMLEELSGKGNGNYAYIDTINEARKTLVEQLDGALITIAKDVKLQVEFNPAEVQAYRLIGYENRRLADRDFNDDKKDAGEIGAGHRVTALYEVVPVGVKFAGPDIDPLKYQKTGSEPEPNAAANSGELMTVKLRYKSPTGGASQLLSHTVANFDRDFAAASGEFKFATSVAGFGMLLRESEDMGKVTKSKVLAWANAGRGTDKHGYRDEFVRLVKKSNT